MRISHKFQFIYFSIPKTGSESIRKFLDPISDQKIVQFPEIDNNNPYYSHMRPCEIQSVFQSRDLNYNLYTRLATVRNPWARIASLYKMTQRNWGDQLRLSFSEWIHTLDPTGNSTAHMPEKWYAHGVMSMKHFLTDQKGQIMVDKVFRIEDQTDELFEAFSLMTSGRFLNQKLFHMNKADQAYDWRSMYCQEAKKRVGDLYAEDIDLFKYMFHNNI